MSIATPLAPPPESPPFSRPDVFVADGITIPGWVADLSSFRRWALSDRYPQSGGVSYLGGTIYVDPSMEELFTHNQVKGAFGVAIANLLGSAPTGLFVHGRMLLTNGAAGLSTEPDGLFFFWETARTNRLELVEGADGIVELLGTPDMVLEVVSKHSVAKDTKTLRELYWKAGIPEYWLVDVRGEAQRFDVLRHETTGYVAVEPVDGWVKSVVFGRQFRIVKEANPLGQPRFTVQVKEE